MNLSDYFCVIGCRLIMACYVGHSSRDIFLKDPTTPQKVAPICLNHIICGRRLKKITQVFLKKILTFLSSMIPFSNRVICRRCGTRTWHHILSHRESVFLMIQSSSVFTATLAMGGCFTPAIISLLVKSITQLRVINIRLFIMLKLWMGRIDP